MPLVSRVLIAPSNRFGSGMKPKSTDDATDSAVERLESDAAHGMVWKERMEWAQAISQGKPDFHGSRVFTDSGLMDARYVARVARAAYKTGTLPSDKAAWGRLRESIRRVYQDLNAGRVA